MHAVSESLKNNSLVQMKYFYYKGSVAQKNFLGERG